MVDYELPARLVATENKENPSRFATVPAGIVCLVFDSASGAAEIPAGHYADPCTRTFRGYQEDVVRIDPVSLGFRSASVECWQAFGIFRLPAAKMWSTEVVTVYLSACGGKRKFPYPTSAGAALAAAVPWRRLRIDMAPFELMSATERARNVDRQFSYRRGQR